MSGELVAPTEQLREVGYNLLPDAAGEAAKLAGFFVGAPTNGPAKVAAELADFAYKVYAESADRIGDAAIAVCKIANGYQLTDELNAGQMPKLPDVAAQPTPNPRADRT